MRELVRVQDEFEVAYARIVETDLFSAVPPPPGPVIERYAGAPWPAGCFA